jgi:hypothetical protein
MFSLNVDRAPSAPVPFESPSPKLRNVQCAKRHPARSLCLSANTSSSGLPAICISITCLASVHAVQGSSDVIKPTIAERSYLRLAIGDAIGGDGDAHRHGSGRGRVPRAEIESADSFPRLFSLPCRKCLANFGACHERIHKTLGDEDEAVGAP